MPTIIVDGQGSGYRRSYKKNTKKKTTKRKTVRKPRINYSKLAAAITKAGVLGKKKPYYRRSSARAPAAPMLEVEHGASILASAAAQPLDIEEEWKLKRTREDDEVNDFSDM